MNGAQENTAFGSSPHRRGSPILMMTRTESLSADDIFVVVDPNDSLLTRQGRMRRTSPSVLPDATTSPFNNSSNDNISFPEFDSDFFCGNSSATGDGGGSGDVIGQQQQQQQHVVTAATKTTPTTTSVLHKSSSYVPQPKLGGHVDNNDISGEGDNDMKHSTSNIDSTNRRTSPPPPQAAPSWMGPRGVVVQKTRAAANADKLTADEQKTKEHKKNSISGEWDKREGPRSQPHASGGERGREVTTRRGRHGEHGAREGGGGGGAAVASMRGIRSSAVATASRYHDTTTRESQGGRHQNGRSGGGGGGTSSSDNDDADDGCGKSAAAAHAARLVHTSEKKLLCRGASSKITAARLSPTVMTEIPTDDDDDVRMRRSSTRASCPNPPHNNQGSEFATPVSGPGPRTLFPLSSSSRLQSRPPSPSKVEQRPRYIIKHRVWPSTATSSSPVRHDDDKPSGVSGDNTAIRSGKQEQQQQQRRRRRRSTGDPHDVLLDTVKTDENDDKRVDHSRAQQQQQQHISQRGQHHLGDPHDARHRHRVLDLKDEVQWNEGNKRFHEHIDDENEGRKRKERKQSALALTSLKEEMVKHTTNHRPSFRRGEKRSDDNAAAVDDDDDDQFECWERGHDHDKEPAFTGTTAVLSTSIAQGKKNDEKRRHQHHHHDDDHHHQLKQQQQQQQLKPIQKHRRKDDDDDVTREKEQPETQPHQDHHHHHHHHHHDNSNSNDKMTTSPDLVHLSNAIFEHRQTLRLEREQHEKARVELDQLRSMAHHFERWRHDQANAIRRMEHELQGRNAVIQYLREQLARMTDVESECNDSDDDDHDSDDEEEEEEESAKELARMKQELRESIERGVLLELRAEMAREELEEHMSSGEKIAVLKDNDDEHDDEYEERHVGGDNRKRDGASDIRARLDRMQQEIGRLRERNFILEQKTSELERRVEAMEEEDRGIRKHSLKEENEEKVLRNLDAQKERQGKESSQNEGGQRKLTASLKIGDAASSTSSRDTSRLPHSSSSETLEELVASVATSGNDSPREMDLIEQRLDDLMLKTKEELRQLMAELDDPTKEYTAGNKKKASGPETLQGKKKISSRTNSAHSLHSEVDAAAGGVGYPRIH